MKPRKPSIPVRVDVVLQRALADLGIARNLDDYRLWKVWDEVVGEMIARNAQPDRLDGGRLVVVVRNSSWLQELSYLGRELTEQLNAAMGRRVVSELHFVPGRVDRDPAPVAADGRAAGDGAASASTPAESIAEAFDRLSAAARARIGRRRSAPASNALRPPTRR